MLKTALLVIDVQESFKHRPFWSEVGFDHFMSAVNAMIGVAHQNAWPIAFVLHNDTRGPFAPESGFVRLLNELDRQPQEPIFNKHVHNALLESGLEPWLREWEIERLIITGLRTEQCCETTARVGSDLGYQIEFVLDATHTFAMTDMNQQPVSVAAIKQHTATVLKDRFAKITCVADYLPINEV